MRPLAVKSVPREVIEKLAILSKIAKNIFLEKCALKLYWTATIKPTKTECSGYFLPDHNGQTSVYTLVSGQPNVPLWRNRNFLTEDEEFEKSVLELCWTAMIKHIQIKCSIFFHSNTTDKLEL